MPSALKPWHAVAIPHDNIQKGRLSEAVFAANLWAVLSSQRGPTICAARRVTQAVGQRRDLASTDVKPLRVNR